MVPKKDDFTYSAVSRFTVNDDVSPIRAIKKTDRKILDIMA